MRKRTQTLCTLLLALFILGITGTPVISAQERVYLELGSTQVRKIRFAVPWFIHKRKQVSGTPFDRNLADTLAKALKFHGIIEIIPAASYNGSQTADWQQLGADFTILGSYEKTADTIAMDLRLFDVSNNKMITGKAYNGTKSQTREMLFRFCDLVLKELTGQGGLCKTQIAFVSQKPGQLKKEVFVTDILGRDMRQVTRHKSLVVSPRFHPDGRHLTYTSYHSGNQNLYVTDLGQNKITHLLSQRRGMNLAPAWTPDGKTFILTLSYKGNPDLFILNRQGQIIKQATKNMGINVSASYSPDGSKIVFVSDRRGAPQLYIMDMQTGKSQRLTYSGSENAEPDWHPKEDLIVYSSLQNGVYQIFTKSSDPESKPRQLTKDLSHHESPSWSPDGNQIIFTKQDGKNRKLYAMMKNGSFQRRLFNIPGNQTYGRWAEKNY